MSNAPRDKRRKRFWGDDDSQANILHIDMDSFFAQVEIRQDPSLVGKAVIVGGSGNRGVVTSATYEARGLGVRAGMPIARARALCPTAVFIPGHFELYRMYSCKVMEIIGRFSPLVEQVSVDEAFVDVKGSRLRFGTPTQIARDIRTQIRGDLGLPASVGIASTKSVAKIASSNAKPDGLLLIPAEATIEFLHGLPVGALWGVGAKSGQILEREGIQTIGQLAEHPVQRLARLLGAAAAHQLHDLAWGIDPRPVCVSREEKSVGMERTFELDIRDRGVLEQFITKAAHECARRLREGGWVCRQVAIKMRGADFSTITRQQRLAAPTDLGREISRIARELFARETLPSGGVRLFGVRAEGLIAREEGFEVMLDQDERPEAAERAMDQIRGKYGAGAISIASLLDENK